MKRKETALILGAGEVGSALAQVLSSAHTVAMIDVNPHLPLRDEWQVDVMHVCFPYDGEFEWSVQDYVSAYQPAHVVIHSTVPVGTSRRCGAVHSPVIGLHPHLAESLVTFVKFLGGDGAGAVADHFRRAGMRVYVTGMAETTELMKLLSTLFYGTCIEFTKDVARLCREAGVPFEAWSLWTHAYNAGYQALGRPEFTRPNLVAQEGPIGGHCVLANAELVASDFADLVKERNARTRGREDAKKKKE